jgi:predicted anti-sigma-YlaC factor YlaD
MEHLKNKKDCSFIRDNLFAYQEKQLTDKDHKRFEDHLLECKECARIVNDFQIVTSCIIEKKSEEPNPFIKTRTIERIESYLKHERSVSNPVFQRILRPVSVSFLLLIAVLIGFSIVRPMEKRFSDSINHQTNIQVMKSALNIPEFIDEGNSLFDNY